MNTSVGVDNATIADHLASIFENHLGPVFWDITICIVEDMKLFMLSKKAKNEMEKKELGGSSLVFVWEGGLEFFVF